MVSELVETWLEFKAISEFFWLGVFVLIALSYILYHAYVHAKRKWKQ